MSESRLVTGLGAYVTTNTPPVDDVVNRTGSDLAEPAKKPQTATTETAASIAPRNVRPFGTTVRIRPPRAWRSPEA
jgi:hypothetical protein